MTEPIQHVYRGRGTHVDRPLCCADVDREPSRVPTIADLVPVTQIMSRDVTCARGDLTVLKLADLMVRNHIGCIPIVNELGGPVGMVTKLDIVEQLVVNNQGSQDIDVVPTTARELMMPLAITLGERATIAHAAALMATEHVHHIPIVDAEGRLIGVVSTMDVVCWLALNDGFSAKGW